MAHSGDFDSYGSSDADNSFESFDSEEFVRMSDGAVIHRDDVGDYQRTYDAESESDDHERRHKTDAIVISSVAGMSAIALGIALRRLKKRQ